jgi:hypothetical protein
MVGKIKQYVEVDKKTEYRKRSSPQPSLSYGEFSSRKEIMVRVYDKGREWSGSKKKLEKKKSFSS